MFSVVSVLSAPLILADQELKILPPRSAMALITGTIIIIILRLKDSAIERYEHYEGVIIYRNYLVAGFDSSSTEGVRGRETAFNESLRVTRLLLLFILQILVLRCMGKIYEINNTSRVTEIFVKRRLPSSHPLGTREIEAGYEVVAENYYSLV